MKLLRRNKNEISSIKSCGQIIIKSKSNKGEKPFVKSCDDIVALNCKKGKCKSSDIKSKKNKREKSPERSIAGIMAGKNEKHQRNDAPEAPKPRPRPRPSPRPREQPKITPTVAPRTAGPKQPLTAKSSNPLKNGVDVARRAPMPIPLLNDIQNARKYEEDLYDEPETLLRSVYDSEPWFFGHIARADCERVLSTYGRQQEFLVRESQRAPGSYALSVKYCYRIRHFPIEALNNELAIGKLTFPNLMEIVNYYQNNPLFYSEHKEPITLGNPFTKDKVPT